LQVRLRELEANPRRRWDWRSRMCSTVRYEHDAGRALGSALCVIGFVYGVLHWGITEPATAGTVMIAALPLLTGVLLLISFINYDV